MEQKMIHQKYHQGIGEKIASARHLRCEKEDTVAKAVGLTRSVISKIESGQYAGLKVNLLIKLGEYLQIPWAELVPPPYSIK
jgi:transcriptional regulator with XRE-family HTH domain